MSKNSRPMSGKTLEILKKTYKRLISKTPTNMNIIKIPEIYVNTNNTDEEINNIVNVCVQSISVSDIDFPLYNELYGKYVQTNDRMETVHIWSLQIAMTNAGRYIPHEISKELYDKEMKYDWNKRL